MCVCLYSVCVCLCVCVCVCMYENTIKTLIKHLPTLPGYYYTVMVNIKMAIDLMQHAVAKSTRKSNNSFVNFTSIYIFGHSQLIYQWLQVDYCSHGIQTSLVPYFIIVSASFLNSLFFYVSYIKPIFV